jgi:ribonuclease R
VRVRVARVNLDERNIDFEMVDMKPRPEKVRMVDPDLAERAGGRRGRGRGASAVGASGKSASKSARAAKGGGPAHGAKGAKKNKVKIHMKKKVRG